MLDRLHAFVQFLHCGHGFGNSRMNDPHLAAHPVYLVRTLLHDPVGRLRGIRKVLGELPDFRHSLIRLVHPAADLRNMLRLGNYALSDLLDVHRHGPADGSKVADILIAGRNIPAQ
ncbi:hypothetical protein D3C81_1989710 [compost metagenome]